MYIYWKYQDTSKTCFCDKKSPEYITYCTILFFMHIFWIFTLFFTVLLDEDDDVYKDNEKEDKNFKLKHCEKKMLLEGSQASDASSTRQTRQKKAARNDSESSNGKICQSV